MSKSVVMYGRIKSLFPSSRGYMFTDRPTFEPHIKSDVIYAQCHRYKYVERIAFKSYKYYQEIIKIPYQNMLTKALEKLP